MKRSGKLFLVIGLLVLAGVVPAESQVSNLLINGQTAGAQIRQGETLTWQYNLSIGGTAQVQIWVDKDSNHVFDPAIDFNLFTFTQQDNGQNEQGPADMDGLTNGQIMIQMPIGLAVAHFFLFASENGVADSTDFQMLPLLQPVYSVFGRVTDDQGNGVPWILLEASVDDNQIMPNFWQALTDSLGNYRINMDSTAGLFTQPWRLRIQNQTGDLGIITPQETEITLSNNYGPIDFLIKRPAMYISGTVLASNGFPLSQQLWAWAWNNTRQLSYGANVNFDGSFKIGFTASDTGNWDVGVGSDVWGKTYMEPASQRRTLTAAGDSLIVNFRVYSINATIWGRVYANGDGRVAHQPVFAQNDTTGRSPDTTDVNGYFRIGVSTVAKKYQVHLDWQVYDQLTQAGYYLTSVYPADAAPGDTVLIEFTQGGSIAGRVVDTLEVPIPGVRVFAQMVNGWQSKEAFTDSAGFYMISGLTEGAYRVQAIKEGFYGEYWNDRANDWQADMVFVNSAQTAEGINFSLSPKISASVPGQNFSQTPAAFALVQNYPNPLSLRSGNLTTIQFQVPQSAQVVIAVYNMLGQEVIRLVDQDFKPGYHEVNWTGVNNQGKYLTCGLYLVRMTALNFSENRKLMIVR